jgi:hypothetical protein
MKNRDTMKTLVDKYFDGKTSCREERSLIEYFSQKKVDKSIQNCQNYFVALGRLQEQNRKEEIIHEKRRRNHFLSARHSLFAATVAASIAAIVLMTVFLNQNDHSGYVIIDGVKHYDQKNMEIVFEKSIQNVKIDMNDFKGMLND